MNSTEKNIFYNFYSLNSLQNIKIIPAVIDISDIKITIVKNRNEVRQVSTLKFNDPLKNEIYVLITLLYFL